jgi:hypothetical protein
LGKPLKVESYALNNPFPKPHPNPLKMGWDWGDCGMLPLGPSRRSQWRWASRLCWPAQCFINPVFFPFGEKGGNEGLKKKKWKCWKIKTVGRKSPSKGPKGVVGPSNVSWTPPNRITQAKSGRQRNKRTKRKGVNGRRGQRKETIRATFR